MKLLIATSNPGKLSEFTMYLNQPSLEIVCLKDLGIRADAPENGRTFLENAVQKAEYYRNKSGGMPVIADDGGLEIDALNGEPGVNSHRWVNKDRESTDEELVSYTIDRLKGVPKDKRGAQLNTVVVYLGQKGDIHHSSALVRGVIAENPSLHRTAGFPYRSLLYLPEIGKFYDHSLLSEAEMEHYNHRGKAIKKLLPVIRKELGV
jgi:XTP/dITP diphosphohydrolase